MGVLSLLPKKSGPGLRLRTDRRPSSGPALLSRSLGRTKRCQPQQLSRRDASEPYWTAFRKNPIVRVECKAFPIVL